MTKSFFAAFLFLFLGSAQAQQIEFPSMEGMSDMSDGSSFIPRFNWDPEFNYEEYVLGPGDVLNLHIYGGLTINTKLYVASNSNIYIPQVGTIPVKGKTLGQFRKILDQRISKVYRNNRAVVALFGPRTFLVEVSGVTKKLGPIPTTALVRLHDFLVRSNVLVDRSSLLEIEIRNINSNDVKKINYQNYVLLGDRAGNPFLRDGDQIIISFSKSAVILNGDLVRPGRFEFYEKDYPLAKIVTDYMGGFLSSAHQSGEIVLTRIIDGNTQTFSFDQKDFFNEKSKVNFYNFRVLDGDKIYFPTAAIANPTMNDSVYVTGQVKTPGVKSYKPGLPVGAYISSAGGLTDRGDYDGIVIYKASGLTLAMTQNVSIEPGDTIQVPEKTFKFWQDHLVILSTLLGFVTTTIAITR
jgi:protein involved in polysaccharide export with SLBB domain